jgi:hypothetical protein
MSYRIRLAFHPDPNGEMPELVAAVDEYTMEAHDRDIIDCPLRSMPDFYRTAIERHDMVRELIVHVEERDVLALFKLPEVTPWGAKPVLPDPRDTEWTSADIGRVLDRAEARRVDL